MVDWECVRDRKQKMISKNNQRENSKRIKNVQKQGDQENRYETPFSGPYSIVMVNDNGTVSF